MSENPPALDVDEYLLGFPPEIRSCLQTIRSTVREVVPDVEEAIRYRMPAFRINGIDLIYFAAFKNHIGIYPPVKGDDKLRQQLAPYLGDKGNLKFPLSGPIPFSLIKKVIKFRLKESRDKLRSKVDDKSNQTP